LNVLFFGKCQGKNGNPGNPARAAFTIRQTQVKTEEIARQVIFSSFSFFCRSGIEKILWR